VGLGGKGVYSNLKEEVKVGMEVGEMWVRKDGLVTPSIPLEKGTPLPFVKEKGWLKKRVRSGFGGRTLHDIGGKGTVGERVLEHKKWGEQRVYYGRETARGSWGKKSFGGRPHSPKRKKKKEEQIKGIKKHSSNHWTAN